MAKRRYVAILQSLSHVPPDSIYRGNGAIDFESDEEPKNIKTKLLEIDSKGVETYRDKAYIPKKGKS